MPSSGRVIAIAAVATCSGFVGGAWFVSSGSAFALFPVPPLPLSTPPAPKVAPPKPAGPPAVGVPRRSHFSGGSAGLMQAATRDDLLPSPGCSWEVEPRPFKPRGQWQKTDPDRAIGGSWWIDTARGSLHYLLVQSTRDGAEIPLRPVYFDEEANRVVPSPGGRNSSGGPGGVFIMTEFSYAPPQEGDISKVAYFAIERVVPDAARLLAEDAQKRAKEKGIAILPVPQLGRPYPFDLVDVDAKTIRQGDFKGKAVVISIAAPGPFGDLGLLAAKRLRESFKPDEVDFVTVSFEGSAGEAKAKFANMGLGGHLVFIPNDLATRRLWVEGAGLDQYPKFFIVDREGVLRFICSALDVEDRVAVLFGRAKRLTIPVARPSRPVRQGVTKAPPAPAGSAPAPDLKKQ